jgi:outer membrane protein OmpA-like peptidoglycan-associated protein
MKQLFLLLLAFSFTHLLKAQTEDAEGCKDHPMFNRLPNFKIIECSQNFASLAALVGEGKTEEHEGTRTHLKYMFQNPDNNLKEPSWLQVKKNYENAIIKVGGKKVYSDASYATYKLTSEGKETWVMLQLTSGEELGVDEYWVDVLQKEAMKQDIEASAMFKEISEKGSIALYINFESGKAIIQPASQGIVDQMAEMLKSNAALKVSIEGHTDNAGTPASNQKLSEERAAALVKALVAKGIDKSRLVSKGWGQTKPVADNATAEGKAKNRRVEIVKM